MAFSDLSAEILDNIVQVLAEEGKIAQYAAISGVFQGVVESRLLSSLNISSPDLETFDKILDSYGHRRSAIRSITLTVVLPTYSDKACSWFETETDKMANNEAFTEAVERLFLILSSCDNVDPAKPISLSLGRVYSPMDISYRGTEKLAADKLAVDANERKDLFEHRYEHSYIGLLRPESLPVVQRVKTISIHTEMGRCLALAVAAVITSKLPSVQTIEWGLMDMERKYRELRTNLRQDLVEALSSLHLEHATSLKLNLSHQPPNNEEHTNMDVRPEDGIPSDKFSTLLGDFLRTSNLVKIELGNPICIGPEVFRLADQGTSWPCLQEFLITFSAVRPDGGWYFDRSATDRLPDGNSNDENQAEYLRMAAWRGEDIDTDSDNSSSGYDSDESFFEDTERPPDHYNESRERHRQGMSPTRGFRTFPSPVLERLLQAAAESTPHMPQLRAFAVGADIQPSERTGNDPQVFEFVFAAAGYENWADKEINDQQYRRLTWTGPREWRPSREVADAWQKTLGEDGIVRYDEW